MKKTIFAGIVVMGTMFIANTSFAQNNIEANSKKAAKEAGCLGDYNGSIDYYINEVGTCNYYCGPACMAIGVLSEVTLVPNPNNHIGPYVKLAPLATVSMCGNDQVQSVVCH